MVTNQRTASLISWSNFSCGDPQMSYQSVIAQSTRYILSEINFIHIAIIGSSVHTTVQIWHVALKNEVCFPLFKPWREGLWSNSYFPQFLSYNALYPLSRVPGETQSTHPLTSTPCFKLDLSSIHLHLIDFRCRLFRFTNHQQMDSFFTSITPATFSISSRLGFSHMLQK